MDTAGRLVLGDVDPATLKLWTDGWKTMLDPIKKVGEATRSWADTMAQIGGSIGESMANMAKATNKSVDDILIGLTKLIVKLLVVKALSFIPGWGGFASSFAGGLLGGLGFDDPTNDLRAWRFGFDFASNFRSGMASSFGNGVPTPGLPNLGGMQPVYVKVYEPGPRTSVEVVREGLSRMSSAEQFEVQRGGLGNAYLRWEGR
jgi:hypothetical protein